MELDTRDFAPLQSKQTLSLLGRNGASRQARLQVLSIIEASNRNFCRKVFQYPPKHGFLVELPVPTCLETHNTCHVICKKNMANTGRTVQFLHGERNSPGQKITQRGKGEAIGVWILAR